MRKAIWIIILLLSQNVFCQQYQYLFDTLLEYEETTAGATRLYLCNSNNDTFSLRVFSRGGTIYGSIKDFKNQITHAYEVVNTANNSIKFNYLYSVKGKHNIRNSKYHRFYDITEKEIDSTKTEITVLTYTDKKKKKVRHKQEFIIDRSELIPNKDIIHLFTDGTFPKSDSQITKGIPLSLKTGSLIEAGCKIHYKLIRKEKISTILAIPKTKKLIHN